MKPQKSIAIANYFIELARQHGQPLSPMKLQKLVFFAHAWWLALTGTPLIDETVEAWEYGPVIPTIYQEFKHYGKDNIKEPCRSFTFVGGEPIASPPELPCPDSNVEALLNKIWEVYSKFSAFQLSNMTHIAGTPWEKRVSEIKAKQGILPKGYDIPDDLIMEYFRSKMSSNGTSSDASA